MFDQTLVLKCDIGLRRQLLVAIYFKRLMCVRAYGHVTCAGPILADEQLFLPTYQPLL
jgi:hypothetical protein